MLNPTGDELTDLHQRALGTPKGLVAFAAYVDALEKRRDFLLRKLDATGVEAEIISAHEELFRLLE